mmetsp:Transcript_97602/g.178394  ORF Transcript_97602/g.178394 Transcript_97602/m.178394 type:complete len:213 (+) Transcript_97602:87-725(+)
MRKVAVVLACLSCAGHGWRKQASATHERDAVRSADALAALLLAGHSGAAFNVGQGPARFSRPLQSQRRATQPVATDFSDPVAMASTLQAASMLIANKNDAIAINDGATTALIIGGVLSALTAGYPLLFMSREENPFINDDPQRQVEQERARISPNIKTPEIPEPVSIPEPEPAAPKKSVAPAKAAKFTDVKAAPPPEAKTVEKDDGTKQGLV